MGEAGQLLVYGNLRKRSSLICAKLMANMLIDLWVTDGDTKTRIGG